DWSGNVRELRNVLERSWVLGGQPRRFEDLNLHFGPMKPQGDTAAQDLDKPFHEAKQGVVDAFELAYVRALLERYDGNLSQAARHAGLSRQHLRDLAKKHLLIDG